MNFTSSHQFSPAAPGVLCHQTPLAGFASPSSPACFRPHLARHVVTDVENTTQCLCLASSTIKTSQMCVQSDILQSIVSIHANHSVSRPPQSSPVQTRCHSMTTIRPGNKLPLQVWIFDNSFASVDFLRLSIRLQPLPLSSTNPLSLTTYTSQCPPPSTNSTFHSVHSVHGPPSAPPSSASQVPLASAGDRPTDRPPPASQPVPQVNSRGAACLPPPPSLPPLQAGLLNRQRPDRQRGRGNGCFVRPLD